MNLEKQSFIRGDSYSFTYKVTDKPSLDDYTVKLYLNFQTRNILESPIVIMTISNGLTVVNKDDGAEIIVAISPSLSQTLIKPQYYYSIKLESDTERITVTNGLIHMQEFTDDYYLKRFRAFIKDEVEYNKGEFYGEQENSEDDLRMYLDQALQAFNDSFFGTSFRFDDIKNENIIFVGAMLSLLTSNGIISARCALTYMDAGGISVVQDLDRYGRYQAIYAAYYQYWKNMVLDFKRSWNIENSFDSIPSDMRWGGFEMNNIMSWHASGRTNNAAGGVEGYYQ